MAAGLPLPDGSPRDRALVEFARPAHAGSARGRRGGGRVARALTVDEAYHAIAVVGLPAFANRAALATGITGADDLR